jgi:hypothetical protein
MDLHVLQRVHGYLGAYSFRAAEKLLCSTIDPRFQSSKLPSS